MSLLNIAFKAIFLVIFVGCAGTSLVKKDVKIEGELKDYPLINKKGFLFGKVKSIEKPLFEEVAKGNFKIEVPLLKQRPVRCTMKSKYSPPGLWISNFVDKLRKKSKRVGIRKVDAGVLNKWPYLYSEIVYSEKKTKSTGIIKVISLTKGENSLLCLHTDLKKSKGLKRVVTDLITSFKTVNKYKGKFIRSHVDITSIKGSNVGFTYKEVYRNKKGNLVTLTRSSLIFPKRGVSLKGIYDIHIEVTDDKGTYLGGSYLGYENLKRKYKMKVIPKEKNKYLVQGNVEGKKIKKSFELGGLLMTSVGQEKMFGSFNEKLKKGLVFYDYIPSMDPLKIYKSRLTHKGRDKEGLHLFDLNLNKTHFKLKVDKKGRPIFSSSKLGKFLIENRRIFSHSEKI
ncbi:MAG: hypothetical protein VYD54_13725 [Bdellovibrionota bacterium]|nr:hypothetical protein [Bdellovibrionota bacterium]